MSSVWLASDQGSPMSAYLTLPSTWATDVHTSGFLLECWRWSSGAYAHAAGSLLTEPPLQSLLSILEEERVSFAYCILLFCFVVSVFGFWFLSLGGPFRTRRWVTLPTLVTAGSLILREMMTFLTEALFLIFPGG